MLMPTMLWADDYDSLWKQVEQAGDKDLPQTQMQELQKIITRARKRGDYGHLLKAELMYSSLQVELTPDSVGLAFDTLEAEAAEAERRDPVMAAVYYGVLGKLYADNYSSLVPTATYSEGHARSKACYAKALSNPALLAKHKAKELKPVIEKGKDSYIFNDDLLSVLGYLADDYETLHTWYDAHGPRQAALLTALELVKKNRSWTRTFHGSSYAEELDSLIHYYGDLKECGEVALERYRFMDYCNDVTKGELLEYINEATTRWSNWPRIVRLKNERQEIINPQYSIRIGRDVQLPGEKTEVYVSDLRNIHRLSIRISRLDLKEPQLYSIKTENQLKKVKSQIVPGSDRFVTKDYQLENEYEILKDTLELPAMEPGNYLLEITTDNNQIEPEYHLYDVTTVTLIHQDLPNRKTRYVVVNTVTGHPMPGATVVLYYQPTNKNGHSETLHCDANGEVVATHPVNETPDYLWAFTDKDRYMPLDHAGWGRNFSYSHPDKRPQRNVQIFTDRAIYRPGQTVHVSLIAFQTTEGWTTEVLPSRELSLTLFDANRKEVKTERLVTDDFGAAEVDFVLPSNGLTGRFMLRVDNPYSTEYIRVEEYKRPTFEVTFDEYKEEYKAGETVILTGHARSYAGVPVQGAKVKYTIRRENARWYWWSSSDRGVELRCDETETDENGDFKVEMPMTLPSGGEGFYQFTASAEVTDLGGESHEGSASLPLGYKSTAFFCNIPEKAEKTKLKTITFARRNAAGKEIDGEVTFTIDGKNERKVKANVPVDIDAQAIGSGQHLLKAKCGDDEIEKKFVLFGLDDQKPCVETDQWFYQTTGVFPRETTDEPAVVQVGTSETDTYILYSIFSGDKVVESGHFTLDNAIQTRRYDYKEEYGSGLLLTYAWIKDGKMHSKSMTISRPLPDKRLNVSWTTFRDKLKPGQKETWTLKVNRPDGKPVPSQIVATMYDKSLEQLAPLSWQLDLGIYQHLPTARWSFSDYDSFSFSGLVPLEPFDVPDLEFSQIDEDLLDNYMSYRVVVNRYDSRRMLGRAGGVMLESAMAAAPEPMMVRANDEMDGEVLKAKEAIVEAPAEEAKGDKGGQAQEQVRENLNETAFFFGRRNVDAKGMTSLVFTLPESVTTWQFKALAHDKDMNYGWLDGECVAKKDVMVQPNMPRFMRVGDNGTITTRIFNTAEKAVGGKVKMQLLDPETQRVLAQEEQSFSVDKGATATATFHVTPTADMPALLVCKIVATGAGFSDGEQHYLPILPSTEWVTNTLSITQHEPGTATVDLQKLFPEGSTQRKLTVEYTNNPAWLMLQTLPYVGNANEKNAISLAAAYYANQIGKYIIDQSPLARQTFQQWKMEQGKETSLMSNLEKNQDLKNLVLEETPWVLEAEHETAQKQALSNFFDETLIGNRINTIFERLADLQQGDGAFPWWQGMPGSPRMTSEVLEFLTRLDMLLGTQKQTQRMIERASNFVSNIAVKEVEEFKQREKEGKPVYISSYYALQWVYLNALSGRKLNSDERDATDYLMNHLKKEIKTQSLYAKALMAIVLYKQGDTQRAKEYVQSLKEYSVFTEKMGRYYDTPRAGYSWCSYTIPTQVAAIEALSLITPDDRQTVDEMKRWLLQQKRTQNWDTPINSVNAVYAFLNGNNNILEHQEPTTFAIDGKTIDLPKATAGIGYVKTTTPKTDGKTFTAQKSSNGTSWGSLYAQFMQTTHDVQASSEGMTVEREVLKDDKPLKDGQVLHVGDKVKVRIVIKVEQDYDYVQVTDKRAACMEPISQLSGYHWGYYIAPKDQATNYYFDMMRKGTHIVEKEYYIDRVGRYETGTCTVQCAYSPEYSARAASLTFVVE